MLFLFHLSNTSASLLRRDTYTTNHISLGLPHARVDVNILYSDEHWAVCWLIEPAVALPKCVKENQQRTGEVELEKGSGIQVRTADRIQCDVELSDQSKNADKQAHPGAPDAAIGLVGKLVQGMTVRGPI